MILSLSGNNLVIESDERSEFLTGSIALKIMEVWRMPKKESSPKKKDPKDNLKESSKTIPTNILKTISKI